MRISHGHATEWLQVRPNTAPWLVTSGGCECDVETISLIFHHWLANSVDSVIFVGNSGGISRITRICPYQMKKGMLACSQFDGMTCKDVSRGIDINSSALGNELWNCWHVRALRTNPFWGCVDWKSQSSWRVILWCSHPHRHPECPMRLCSGSISLIRSRTMPQTPKKTAAFHFRLKVASQRTQSISPLFLQPFNMFNHILVTSLHWRAIWGTTLLVPKSSILPYRLGSSCTWCIDVQLEQQVSYGLG